MPEIVAPTASASISPGWVEIRRQRIQTYALYTRAKIHWIKSQVIHIIFPAKVSMVEEFAPP